jgi:hypothetical protein
MALASVRWLRFQQAPSTVAGLLRGEFRGNTSSATAADARSDVSVATEVAERAFPENTGIEHEQDALEDQSVRIPLATRVPNATFHLGWQRVDHSSQLAFVVRRLRPSHVTPPAQAVLADGFSGSESSQADDPAGELE